MPRRSPFVIDLSQPERETLEARSRKYTAPYREVIRARIVLMAAQGLENKTIASRLDLPVQIVCKWRKRFFEQRLAGLEERPRTGRRPVFPPELVMAVKAIACELPARLGLPFSRLQVPDIQAEVLRGGLVASISDMTIWRWLDEDAIKPWTHRSWIFPRDPDFEPKAARVLDLYARQFEGRALTPDEFVVSADEKTSIQARVRRHPSVAANSRHPMLVEHEYERGGSLAYLAAWDVHRTKLFGRLEPTTGIAPFERLVSQVMAQEPYRSARRVFWIVDNGSSHRGDASVRRLQKAHPNVVPVHLPSMPVGSTRSRSTSRSSNAKSSPRPTWTRSTSWRPTSWPSRLATRPWPNRSSGSSPEPTSPSCSNGSLPRTTPNCRRQREYITEFLCQSTKPRPARHCPAPVGSDRALDDFAATEMAAIAPA